MTCRTKCDNHLLYRNVLGGIHQRNSMNGAEIIPNVRTFNCRHSLRFYRKFMCLIIVKRFYLNECEIALRMCTVRRENILCDCIMIIIIYARKPTNDKHIHGLNSFKMHPAASFCAYALSAAAETRQ